MATEQISVDIGDKKFVIFRDEILQSTDKTLRDTFVIREETLSEIVEAEKKLLQLRHALSSMDNTLQQAALKHVRSKVEAAVGAPEKNVGESQDD